jgi:hypothetical protein
MSFRLTSLSFAVLIGVASAAQADCAGDIQSIMKSVKTSLPYSVEISSTASDEATHHI